MHIYQFYWAYFLYTSIGENYAFESNFFYCSSKITRVSFKLIFFISAVHLIITDVTTRLVCFLVSFFHLSWQLLMDWQFNITLAWIIFLHSGTYNRVKRVKQCNMRPSRCHVNCVWWWCKEKIHLSQIRRPSSTNNNYTFCHLIRD